MQFSNLPEEVIKGGVKIIIAYLGLIGKWVLGAKSAWYLTCE